MARDLVPEMTRAWRIESVVENQYFETRERSISEVKRWSRSCTTMGNGRQNAVEAVVELWVVEKDDRYLHHR